MRRTLPALFTVSLLLAACGDDDDGGSSTEDTPGEVAGTGDAEEVHDDGDEPVGSDGEASTTDSTGETTGDDTTGDDTTGDDTTGDDTTGDDTTGDDTTGGDPDPDGGAYPDKPIVEIPTEPPGELQVETLIEGTGPEAADGDLVIVDYVGVRSSDGVEFDASYDR